MKKILLIGVFAVLFGFVSANAQTASVTFTCNMGVKICEQAFTPGTDSVQIRGSFDSWGSGVKLEATNDSIWTTTMDLNVSDTVYFKFYTTHGSGVWEDDPNREVIVPSGGTSYEDYFNRDSVCNPVGTGNILFTLDMSTMEQLGIFDADAGDSVIISASFNGWTTDINADSKMNRNVTNPSLWTKNVTFTNEPLGADEAFKYVVKLADTSSIWTDGYERPLSQGGGNRDIIFNGAAQAYYSSLYDDVNPEWIVNSGTNLQVTFTVDMTTATNADSQAVQFVPGTDSVFWVSEEPAFQQTQGWTQDGRVKQVPLTQQSGNIYSGSYTLTDPSFNGFEYRYAFKSESDGTVYYENAGFGDFAYRVRFVDMSAPHTFTNPFDFPQDSWTNAGVQVHEGFPPTGVKPVDNVVKSYQLSQNYPNPFNPSTTIKFSIPEKNMVSLKIFNVLGQEVKTLINHEYSAGSYEVNFDASKLSSGIYFYTISTGDFHATKKMILMK